MFEGLLITNKLLERLFSVAFCKNESRNAKQNFLNVVSSYRFESKPTSVSRTVDQYKVETKHLFCIYPQQKDYLRHWSWSHHCNNTQTQSFILFV